LSDIFTCLHKYFSKRVLQIFHNQTLIHVTPQVKHVTNCKTLWCRETKRFGAHCYSSG